MNEAKTPGPTPQSTKPGRKLKKVLTYDDPQKLMRIEQFSHSRGQSQIAENKQLQASDYGQNFSFKEMTLNKS